MFVEFLEAHGQETILKDIKDENGEVKTEESSFQEKTDEEPVNNIANADISDFEVIYYKYYNMVFM